MTKNTAYWKSKHAASEKNSPFKVSDEALVKAQKKLDKSELSWKANKPAWTSAFGKKGFDVEKSKIARGMEKSVGEWGKKKFPKVADFMESMEKKGSL